MKLLVMGSTGFLGRRVLPLLQTDPFFNEVRVWDRERDGDLLNPVHWRRVLDQVRPERVLNMAWLRTGTDDYELAPGNLEWFKQTVDMATFCLDQGISVVLVGSAIDAEERLPGKTPYLEAKKELRDFVEAVSTSSPVTLLRPTYVFDQEIGRPRVLKQFYESNRSPSFQLHHPEICRDYIHVDDVASAIALVTHQPKAGLIDIASGRNRSTATLLASSLSVVDARHPIQDMTVEESDSGFDLTFIRALGWNPTATDRYFASPTLQNVKEKC